MSAEEGPVSLSDAPTRRLTMIEAINEALDLMLERDPDVVVFGEDVADCSREAADAKRHHGMEPA